MLQTHATVPRRRDRKGRTTLLDQLRRELGTITATHVLRDATRICNKRDSVDGDFDSHANYYVVLDDDTLNYLRYLVAQRNASAESQA